MYGLWRDFEQSRRMLWSADEKTISIAKSSKGQVGRVRMSYDLPFEVSAPFFLPHYDRMTVLTM